MANKLLGNKIKYFRLKSGMTQQQLSDKLGLKNKSTLGSWEVGKSEPDFLTISKLCGLFKIDPNTLFGILSPSHDNSEAFSDAKKHFLDSYEMLNLKNKHYIEIRVNELLNMQRVKEDKEEKEISKATPPSKMSNVIIYDTKASAGTGTGIYGDIPYEMVEFENVPHGTDHAIIIRGNSMEPRYIDSQVVFVKEQPQLEIGQIGIFIIDDQLFMKKFSGDRLISLNKNYEDILLKDTECRCIGRVLN